MKNYVYSEKLRAYVLLNMLENLEDIMDEIQFIAHLKEYRIPINRLSSCYRMYITNSKDHFLLYLSYENNKILSSINLRYTLMGRDYTRNAYSSSGFMQILNKLKELI